MLFQQSCINFKNKMIRQQNISKKSAYLYKSFFWLYVIIN